VLKDSDERKLVLAGYRIIRSRELITVSRQLLVSGHFKDSINRSYFAMFSAMRAVLALDGFDAKKHYGVLSEFRKLYIKTDVFPEEYSEFIGDAFQVRNDSDYDDLFIASEEDAASQLEHAESLVSAIEEFLTNLT